MKVVIDRIEDGVASVELENGKILQVPAELFCGCCEGDIVEIAVNKKLTELRKKTMRINVSELFDN